MSNYPDFLISAMKGLLNDHTNNEITTEFFKENSNSNSELKNKLNLLEKQFNQELISDYLANYDKYQRTIITNQGENNSSYNKNEINKIDFNPKNTIKSDSDDFSSIFKVEKNEDNIGKTEGFLSKKLKRENEFNSENKSTKKKENKNNTKKLNKEIRNNTKDNLNKVKTMTNTNNDYDFISNNEEKELDKENEQNSLLDSEITINSDIQKNNENYEENDNESKQSIENESKEEQNNNIKDNDFFSFTHDSVNDIEDFYFKGERKKGKKHGFGIYKSKDKKEYFKGYWVDNELQGFGIYVNERTYSYYKGNFVDTYFDGYGRLSIKYPKELHVYEGEFKKDKINGFGIYYYNKKKTIYYMGDFKNDMKNGIGISVQKGQFTYECEYKNDIEDGIGTLNYNDGDIYKGEIFKGKLEGYGIHKHNKKDIHQESDYYGFFKNGDLKFGFFIKGNNKYFAEFQGLNIKKILKTLK